MTDPAAQQPIQPPLPQQPSTSGQQFAQDGIGSDDGIGNNVGGNSGNNAGSTVGGAENYFPQVDLPPEQLLYAWDAPNRPYKKRDREYYTTIAIIVVLLSVILFFAGQFILIAVIMSFAFVSYTLAAVPPETATHAITTYGIRTGDKLYYWGELGRFWFTERLGQKVVNIEYFHKFIGSIILLLGETKEEEMKSLLTQFLRNETPLPTFIEKATSWLQKKFPLDKNG